MTKVKKYTEVPFQNALDYKFQELIQDTVNEAVKAGEEVEYTRSIAVNVIPVTGEQAQLLADQVKAEKDVSKAADLIQKAMQVEVTVTLSGELISVMKELDLLLKDDNFYQQVLDCVEGSAWSKKPDFRVQALRFGNPTVPTKKSAIEVEEKVTKIELKPEKVN